MVVRNRVRPIFPQVWKMSNPAVRSLKETIEECWDQEPEARLTVVCVAQRLGQISQHWDRYKQHSSHKSDLVMGENESGKINNWVNKNNYHNNKSFTNNSIQNNQNSGKIDNLLSRQNPPAHIQPHQGTNPCWERNIDNNQKTEKLVEKSTKENIDGDLNQLLHRLIDPVCPNLNEPGDVGKNSNRDVDKNNSNRDVEKNNSNREPKSNLEKELMLQKKP